MAIPNMLTLLRFVLAVLYFTVLFGFVKVESVPSVSHKGTGFAALDVALILFCVAVATDFLDGYIARKKGMKTKFGRVADPVVDKVLICGSLIFFASVDAMRAIVMPWMVVIVVGRELLITGVRSIVEKSGIAMESTWFGKEKMLVQCIAIVAGLIYLGHFLGDWRVAGITMALVWLMLLSTLLSGILYVVSSRKVLAREI